MKKEVQVPSLPANSPPENPPQLFTTKQAAVFLQIQASTLEQWRWAGRGPKFCKIGTRACRYRIADLEAFLEERVFTSTTAAGVGVRV